MDASQLRGKPRALLCAVLSLLAVATAVGEGVAPASERRADNGRLWPLEVPSALTSTFGEYRSGYFHSGIDLSTWGRTGVPVFAIGDGHVFRVRASGVGYGRAIYIRLDDGPVVVYAHLDGYMPALGSYVRAEQERLRRYEVDLHPEPGRFSVRRGEVIGYSGDSGAGPPHLHFEIRNHGADVARNPLAVTGYAIEDHRPPTFVDVTIHPASDTSLVGGGPESLVLALDDAGEGSLAVPEISVRGPVVLSTHAFDRADGKNLRLAIYRLALVAGDSLAYEARLDSVPYAMQREVDLVYDGGRATNGQRRVRRLYRAGGSTLGVHVAGDGVLRIPDGMDRLPLRVEASDFYGNASIIELTLVRDPAAGDRAPPPPRSAAFAAPDSMVFTPRAGVAHFGLEVALPAGVRALDRARLTGKRDVEASVLALGQGTTLVRFDPARARGRLTFEALVETAGGERVPLERELPLWVLQPDRRTRARTAGLVFEVEEGDAFDASCVFVDRDEAPEPREPGLRRVSPVHRLRPFGLVLRRDALLMLEPSAPDTVDEKVGLYRFDERKRGWVFAGDRRDAGAAGGGIRTMGRYCLIRDESVPIIRSARPRGGARIRDRRPEISVGIVDTGSGLHWTTLSLLLDGEELIAEWDPERPALRGRPGHVLSSGQHAVRVIASDLAGNKTEAVFSFLVVDE